ncbi:hypothetical protein DFJ73DRAFT_347294 [Zopfochytrium polystomum]|nr:hypothetical protein DFJ73DRAFT_347294 [Zopfochytrium polystomum]
MCAVLTPKDKAYAGIRLHLSISIPMNYPTDSPKVSIDTPIEHPNIFGSYVCCDILKGRLVQDPKTGEIGGYTPAYPLQTVLVQLLSFFTAEKVDQEHTDKSVKRKMQTFAQLKECVSRFSCKHCGFAPPPEVPACEKCGTRPQLPKNREGPVVSCRECGSEVKLKPPPKIPAWYPVTAAGSSSARGKAGKKAAAAAAAATAEKKPVLARCAPRTRPNALDRIIPDVWYMIFARISAKDISAVTAAYPRLKQMINVDSIVIRRNLSCFYLRSGHDDSILGVGVQITAVTKRKVKYSSAFDILSYFAFRESKIRESPWGETFTHFLPLVINYRHFKRARPDIEATLMALNARDEPFDPAVIIPTFARWMNQMVVDLMKDVLLNADVRNAEPRYGKPLLHASEKALTGYCTLMHLLLVMVGTYPQVLQPTYDKVRAFLSDPQARQKSHVPDLGELLIWLILVPGLSWSVVQRPLIEELLTRNVVWVLNQHPHLAHIEHRDCVSERRLQETFKGGLTGLRLLLFQVRFLKDLVWAATDSSTKTTAPAAAAGSGRPIVRVPPPAVVVPPSPARGPDPAVADADDVLFVDRISAASPSKGLSPSRPVSPVSAEQQDEQDDWVVVNRKPQRKPLPALRGGRQSNDRQANATAPNQRPGPSSATVRPSQPTPTPAPSPSPTSPPPTVLPPFDDARSIAHIAALIKTSDATFGFPAPDLAANLAAYARSVLRVADFQAFYSLLEASPDPPRSTPPPPPPASGPSGADSNPATPPPSQPPPPQPTQLSICRALRAAVNRSRAAKYHRTPYTVGELWSLRAAVEPHAAGPTPPSGSQLPQVLPGKRSFFPVPPRRPGVGDGGDGEAGGRRPARRGPPLRRRRQVVHAFKEMSPDCGCSTCVFLRRYQKEVGALTLGDEGEEDYDEYEDGESYFDEDD